MVETKKIMWMIKKDLLVLWRHKPRLFSIFLFPIIMITLFGYGMGGELENIPVVVVERRLIGAEEKPAQVQSHPVAVFLTLSGRHDLSQDNAGTRVEHIHPIQLVRHALE